MKEEIIRLRGMGKSYNEISSILGCSKGTISYHCGEGQKDKYAARLQKSRKKTVISNRVAHFKNKDLRGKSDDLR